MPIPRTEKPEPSYIEDKPYQFIERSQSSRRYIYTLYLTKENLKEVDDKDLHQRFSTQR